MLFRAKPNSTHARLSRRRFSRAHLVCEAQHVADGAELREIHPPIPVHVRLIRSTGYEPPRVSKVSEPLSSELGTYKTVEARFWPWLSGKVQIVQNLPKSTRPFPSMSAYRSTRWLQGYLSFKKISPLGPYRRPMPRVLVES